MNSRKFWFIMIQNICFSKQQKKQKFTYATTKNLDLFSLLLKPVHPLLSLLHMIMWCNLVSQPFVSVPFIAIHVLQDILNQLQIRDVTWEALRGRLFLVQVHKMVRIQAQVLGHREEQLLTWLVFDIARNTIKIACSSTQLKERQVTWIVANHIFQKRLWGWRWFQTKPPLTHHRHSRYNIIGVWVKHSQPLSLPLGVQREKSWSSWSWCCDQRPRDCRPKMCVQNNDWLVFVLLLQNHHSLAQACQMTILYCNKALHVFPQKDRIKHEQWCGHDKHNQLKNTLFYQEESTNNKSLLNIK